MDTKQQLTVSVVWYDGIDAKSITGDMIAKTGLAWFPWFFKENEKNKYELSLQTDRFAEVAWKARVVQFELWEKHSIRSFLLVDSKPIELWASGLEIRCNKLENAINQAIESLRKTRSWIRDFRFQGIRTALENVMHPSEIANSRLEAYDLFTGLARK